MAKKLMRVTLDLMVEDLPDEEMRRHAEEMDVSIDELPTLEGAGIEWIAAVLDGGITPPGPHGIACEAVNEILFEGSELFVTFTAAKVVSAEWKDGEAEPAAGPIPATRQGPDEPTFTLIREALRFANFAAGEGIAPAEPGVEAGDPADFLTAFLDKHPEATDDVTDFVLSGWSAGDDEG